MPLGWKGTRMPGRGLLAERGRQVDLGRFKREEVISGEEAEKTLDFLERKERVGFLCHF